MNRLATVLTAGTLAACVSSPDDVEPDVDLAPSSDDGATTGGVAPLTAEVEGARAPAPAPLDCAVAPLGDLASTGSTTLRGSSNYHHTAADITWRVAYTVGCVDHYLPASGTIHVDAYVSNCGGVYDPPSAPVDPSDGTLTLDRSTSPVRYVMNGHGTFDATFRCSDDSAEEARPVQAGGLYSLHDGSFDGDVHGGGTVETSGSRSRTWRLWRAGADFTPPAPGTCSEPPHDRWLTRTSYYAGEAEVTWTRASTDGCVDTFTPSGVVRYRNDTDHTPCHAVPGTAAVGPTDGTFRIDRSTNPPTFYLMGHTQWPAQVTCYSESGSIYHTGDTASRMWARVDGAFDGNVFGGAYRGDDRSRWYVAKL